ncbi:MAG: hypothetical protein WCT41_01030 [Candidatus Paceibacterota bacterium]|jgi:hypothetical protein
MLTRKDVIAAIIAEAIKKCGCPEEKYMACAAVFGQTEGSVDHLTHSAVLHFSRWMMTRSAREIGNRMSCSGGSDRVSIVSI